MSVMQCYYTKALSIRLYILSACHNCVVCVFLDIGLVHKWGSINKCWGTDGLEKSRWRPTFHSSTYGWGVQQACCFPHLHKWFLPVLHIDFLNNQTHERINVFSGAFFLSSFSELCSCIHDKGISYILSSSLNIRIAFLRCIWFRFALTHAIIVWMLYMDDPITEQVYWMGSPNCCCLLSQIIHCSTSCWHHLFTSW